MKTATSARRGSAARPWRARPPRGVAFCLLVLAPVAACSGEDPASSRPSGEVAGANADAGTITGADGLALQGDAGVAATQALEDEQIVAVVHALHAGELEQAEVALLRLEDDAVRSFADLMREEHQAGRQALAALAAREQLTPEPNDVAALVRLNALSAITRIGAAEEDDVDRVYIDTQVVAHGVARELLDHLARAADSDALRAQLSELRINVQGHLEAARGLQLSLGG